MLEWAYPPLSLPTHMNPTMGLATRERGSRSIPILSGLAKSRMRYTVNRRSRFAPIMPMLRVAFEDAVRLLPRTKARHCSHASVTCAYVH